MLLPMTSDVLPRGPKHSGIITIFQGVTRLQVENQVLCADLAPIKRVAHDAEDFGKDSGSCHLFPRLRRRTQDSRTAGMGKCDELNPFTWGLILFPAPIKAIYPAAHVS